MDIQSVMTKLDALLHESRLEEADVFLADAIAQAEDCGEVDAQKMLLNEQIGFFRDCGRFPEALTAAAKARALFESRGETDTISYATTLLNCANAYRAAGEYQQAADAFETVRTLYTALLPPDDDRIAGLWNNLSLLHQELGEWDDACRCLEQALEIAERIGDETKIAISDTNLAVSLLQSGETDRALSLLQQANAILCGKSPSDFHYSAVLAGFGDVYFKLADYDRAATYYEMALAEIDLHMGQNNFYAIVSDNLAQAYAKQHADRPRLSGMELCRRFYRAFGEPMLRRSFPELVPQLAIGLAGEGSECLGYDDALSQDHDFGPGFCIWVSDNMPQADVERLQKSYDALPKQYYGFVRKNQKESAGRIGVCRIGSFFHRLIGLHRPPTTLAEWRSAEEASLAAAISGEIFSDPSGEFTQMRQTIEAGYPEPVYLRRLAQALGRMAQCGQYNYIRMRRRGERAAAQLYLTQFCRNTMQAAHLLCHVYAPYEKWICKSTRQLPGFAELAQQIESLLLMPPQIGVPDDPAHDAACEKIEAICGEIAKIVKQRHAIPTSPDGYLMPLAESLAEQAEQIESQSLVADQIAELEFHAFDTVQNTDGRAACQNDWETFRIMRHSQYVYWPKALSEAWRDYFAAALDQGRNLISEKYAWMMESTDPEKFDQLRCQLPQLTDEFIKMREAIVAIQVTWMEEFAAKYPKLALRARRIHTSEDTKYDTSFETYLRGELSVYPPEILYGYGRWIVSLYQEGKNLQMMTMEDTVHAYGYTGLEQAEAAVIGRS